MAFQYANLVSSFSRSAFIKLKSENASCQKRALHSCLPKTLPKTSLYAHQEKVARNRPMSANNCEVKMPNFQFYKLPNFES